MISKTFIYPYLFKLHFWLLNQTIQLQRSYETKFETLAGLADLVFKKGPLWRQVWRGNSMDMCLNLFCTDNNSSVIFLKNSLTILS